MIDLNEKVALSFIFLIHLVLALFSDRELRNKRKRNFLQIHIFFLRCPSF